MSSSFHSRRRFLHGSAALLIASRLPAILQAAPAADACEAAAEKAVAELWRRFVMPAHGTILHYAGLNGEVIVPTAEECAALRPNGGGWMTPIEDGPMFGGLLLDGLCNRWRKLRTEESATQARRIARGLVKLAHAGGTPGFVARGLTLDGKAHYPGTSEDQTLPWFYGLWRYVRSGLPEAAEKRELTTLMEKTALALEGHGWQIPCDPLSFGYRGNYIRAKHIDAARLLFLHRALYDLTGHDRWLARYRTVANEVIGDERRSRREWCAVGMDYVSPSIPTYNFTGTSSVSQKLWTSSMSQAALRGLWEMETDEEWRRGYRRGLGINARNAIVHLVRHRRLDEGAKLTFDIDWHFLEPSWKPQANCDEAILLMRTQLPLWGRHNPRSVWEDDTVREPLFAAWIVTLAADPDLMRECRDEIDRMLVHYRWDELYTSLFFAAVCVQYQPQT